jgi:hypothetical protein
VHIRGLILIQSADYQIVISLKGSLINSCMITAQKLPKIISEEIEFTFPKENWDKKETAIRVARLYELPLDETIGIIQKINK